MITSPGEDYEALLGAHRNQVAKEKENEIKTGKALAKAKAEEGKRKDAMEQSSASESSASSSSEGAAIEGEGHSERLGPDTERNSDGHSQSILCSEA